jgi:DNA-binding beta-propeller fold protein YncE
MISRPNRGFVAASAVLGAIALLCSSGNEALSARTRNIGTDRIVSVQALPETDGEMCPLPDRALLSAVTATPQQGQAPAVVATPSAVRSRAGNINRKPLRYIKDPYPAWSSIAVNAEHDMVVMTDENLFRVVEYSRLDNTPPGGSFTEPRRVIGGDKTRMEMLCGAYIDPKTLEVYAVNNDTQDWMPVFSREARGNVAPDRVLATPHRTWGIAADETRQELFMTIQSPSAVVVYRKAAANNEAPLRFLEGDATQLADPRGIALDMQRDLVIVANHGHRRFYGGPAVSRLTRSWEEWIAPADDLNGLPRAFLPGLGAFEMPSINIYARGASGNTPPQRVIKGPKTRLNWPSHIAVYEGRGEIFVANDADDSILVFRVTDSGDVAPIRVIKGARTRLKNPTGLALDARNDEVWVANMGNYTAAAFRVTADGDVPPVREIRAGPPDQVALMIGNPGAAAYDSKRQEILVPN